MTLNVNLEDVPWEILEAVKARILANRRRNEENQNTTESLSPRPQIRKFGATSRSYQVPEPGGSLYERTGLGFFHYSNQSGLFSVQSGNGEQSAEASVPSPFPGLSNLSIQPAAWFPPDGAQFEYITFPTHLDGPVTPFGRNSSSEISYTWVTPLREQFPGQPSSMDLWNQNYFYYELARHSTEPLASDLSFFPLGNGKTYLLYTIFGARRSWIRERAVRQFSTAERKLVTVDSLLSMRTVSVTPATTTHSVVNDRLESDTVRFQQVAFICSETEAKEAPVVQPLAGLILTRIRSKLKGTSYQVNNARLGGDFNAPFTGLRQYPMLGPSSFTGYNFDPPLPFPFPSYGFAGAEASTPAAWFTVGLPEISDSDAFSTHEKIRNYSLSGQTIRSLIKGNKYLGVLLDDSSNDPGPEKIYSWKGGLPSGTFNPFDEPTEESSNWSFIGLTFPPAPQGFNRVYINDWGSPEFCRQQAARWGLSQF